MIIELQLDVLQLTLLTRGHELALRDLAVLVGVDPVQHAAELIELLAVKNALVAHVSSIPHTRAILRLGLGLLPTQRRRQEVNFAPGQPEPLPAAPGQWPASQS